MYYGNNIRHANHASSHLCSVLPPKVEINHFMVRRQRTLALLFFLLLQ